MNLDRIMKYYIIYPEPYLVGVRLPALDPRPGQLAPAPLAHLLFAGGAPHYRVLRAPSQTRGVPAHYSSYWAIKLD